MLCSFIRELKRWGWQWQWVCCLRRLRSKNNRLHVYFTLWYISLPSCGSAKQQHEMTKFRVFSKTWVHDGKFFFLYSYFNTVHNYLGPGQFTNENNCKRVTEMRSYILKIMTFSLLSLLSLLKLPILLIKCVWHWQILSLKHFENFYPLGMVPYKISRQAWN